jgi:hypothetical protein
VAAEVLSRHPQDNNKLVQALGAVMLLAQDGRHTNDELLSIIVAARRRGE